MVFGPFYYCAFCERAAPDAPETIDDQRRCTAGRDRTIYGASRGSASLPAPAERLGPIISTVGHKNLGSSNDFGVVDRYRYAASRSGSGPSIWSSARQLIEAQLNRTFMQLSNT